MKMKIIGFFLLILFTAGLPVLMAFRSVEKKWSDIFQKLGIEKSEASQYVSSNFLFGNLSVPYSTKYKMIVAGSRSNAVKELGIFIKATIASQEFRKSYEEARKENKPVLPDHAAELKEKIAELKENLKNAEEMYKSAPASDKEMYRDIIKVNKEQLEILQNPKHPDYGLYTGMSPDMLELEKKDYQEKMAEFQNNWPADVNVVIARRLKAFLDLTKNINFNAKLVSRNDRMIFADPELEAKDDDWKRCFRAGKETIDAARSFASQWLSELKR